MHGRQKVREGLSHPGSRFRRAYGVFIETPDDQLHEVKLRLPRLEVFQAGSDVSAFPQSIQNSLCVQFLHFY